MSAAIPMSHDIHSLYNVLQHTFSSDPDMRKLAENHILSIKQNPSGYLLMLIQIVAEPTASRDVQQAACITIKNVLREKWDHRIPGNNELFNHAEKDQMRSLLLETLVHATDSSLKDLLSESIKEVCAVDFPEHWPSFLPVIVGYIQTGEVMRVHNSLLALRKVVKRYEYRSVEKRESLHLIVNATFPLLHSVFETLLPNMSDDAISVIHIILKIFWSTTQFALPPSSCNQALDLVSWMNLIGGVLERDVKNQPGDIALRAQWPGWKAKKWASQIVTRFFARYGNPYYAAQGNEEFAQQFSTTMASPLLEKVMHLLALRPRGEYCTDRVVHNCISYVSSSIELSHTYKLLKPHLDFLLVQVLFPCLCLSEEDVVMFETCPHEFVHRNNDPMQEYQGPKQPAISLILDMVKYRAKDTLPRILGFITQVLTVYAAAPPEQRDYRQKDGALVALGSMHGVLKSKKKYSESLEGLLVQHVFPEFGSHVGYMRSRAFWMMQHFANIKFTDPNNLLYCLMCTIQALQDKELPVQVEAANSLKFLIDATDAAESTLVPLLPAVLEQYFKIMQEIGNDLVVQGLQSIIDRFGDHIGPHASSVAHKLCQYFMEYAKDSTEDDDAAMAAAQCMEALSTLLQSASKFPELYPVMETSLVPVLHIIFKSEDEYIEFFENALDIISYLSYYSKTITPLLWTIFPLVFEAFDKWATDYVCNVRVVVENFVSKDGKAFAGGTNNQGVPYVVLVINMSRSVLTDQRFAETDVRAVLQLLSSVLHNCQGLIDVHMGAILDVVMWRASGTGNSPGILVGLAEALSSALYYNAPLVFQILEANMATGHMLDMVLKATSGDNVVPHAPRKVICLGLCNVLALPLTELPVMVQQSMFMLLSQLISLLSALKSEGESDDKIDKCDDVDEDIEDASDDGANANVERDEYDESGSDQETTDDADDVGYLKTFRHTRHVSGGNSSWIDVDDDDDTESDEFDSPIDNIDTFIFFSEAYNTLSTNQPEILAQLQYALSPDQRNACDEILREAAERAKHLANAVS